MVVLWHELGEVEMSLSHIILDCLPSFCQKLSELVKIWGSYDKKNNFAFFLDTVYIAGETL